MWAAPTHTPFSFSLTPFSHARPSVFLFSRTPLISVLPLSLSHARLHFIIAYRFASALFTLIGLITPNKSKAVVGQPQPLPSSLRAGGSHLKTTFTVPVVYCWLSSSNPLAFCDELGYSLPPLMQKQTNWCVHEKTISKEQPPRSIEYGQRQSTKTVFIRFCVTIHSSSKPIFGCLCATGKHVPGMYRKNSEVEK